METKTRSQMRKSRNKNWINILCILLAVGLLGAFLNFNKIKKNWDWITMKPRQELNVPLEKQLPDLPNGCEVTSLSMLLNYYRSEERRVGKECM